MTKDQFQHYNNLKPCDFPTYEMFMMRQYWLFRNPIMTWGDHPFVECLRQAARKYPNDRIIQSSYNNMMESFGAL